LLIWVRWNKVTARTRRQFDFPFECHGCGLATTVHVWADGQGQATMLYDDADANEARRDAADNASLRARRTFEASPCPRCGGPSSVHASALAAWRAKAESHEKARPRINRIGFLLVVLTSGACAALLAVTGAGGGESAAAGLLWLVFGAAVVRGVNVVIGPGRAPALLRSVPSNVSFDAIER
jgi:hypothetical protein